MAAKKKLTFEERLQQVEALIAKMESGEMPLGEAMQQYEAGLNALNALEKELTAAQQRLTVLRRWNIRCWRAASGFARCCCWPRAKPSAGILERRCRLPVRWK